MYIEINNADVSGDGVRAVGVGVAVMDDGDGPILSKAKREPGPMFRKMHMHRATFESRCKEPMWSYAPYASYAPYVPYVPYVVPLRIGFGDLAQTVVSVV